VKLLRTYQVLAYVTAVFLLVLTVGMPLKYLAADGSGPQELGDWITHYVGIAHGWLYMAYVAVTLILSDRQKWSMRMTVLVALAGTIPTAAFFAERRVVEKAQTQAAERSAAAV
jgi:integral membrane protein